MKATTHKTRAEAGRRFFRRAALALALVLLGTLPGLAPPGFAQPRSAAETELKAAFILNFARYTRWPKGAFTNGTAPLVIGVLGRDPIEPALEKLLRDQTVGRRTVQFARFESGAAATNCHVLFLGEAQRARLTETLEALRARPVLTVSDLSPFATRGGMLGIVRRDGRLRFEANPEAAQEAGLQLSSRLLQLATVVKTGPP
jgi:hypothetical protein